MDATQQPRHSRRTVAVVQTTKRKARWWPLRGGEGMGRCGGAAIGVVKFIHLILVTPQSRVFAQT